MSELHILRQVFKVFLDITGILLSLLVAIWANKSLWHLVVEGVFYLYF